MKPEISAVVVSHRTSSEAIDCVASLREALRAEAIAGEVILVDCGSGEEEARRLRDAGADRLIPLPDNRGYSGGLNAGLARARAPLLLLSNADVVFSPGSLRFLLEAAARPAVGAAGPLCTWDGSGRLRLPPGFAPGFARDFLQLSAGRFPRLERRRFAAFARECLELWREGGSVRHLTGAVLAARRDVLDRVGRFDERFLLEYEETEWEDRVLAAGFELRYEPRARVRHLYARSSLGSTDSAGRRRASRDLYVRRRYGRFGARLLDAAGRLARPVIVERMDEPRAARREGAWIAISPNPSLLPFVGAPLDEDFQLPPETLASLPTGAFFRTFRACDGEPLSTFRWEKAAA
ncbi:MAG: hypothetical protein DMF55_05810 [Acidobacteria bacterium]|nr:MAG: hypothetical protein DMF55_05810 [Acidobacteriota bacterium]